DPARRQRVRQGSVQGDPAPPRLARRQGRAARAERRRRHDDRRAGRGRAVSRFVVGIDLGTTNSALAFVDTQNEERIQKLEIPQVVAPGQVAARLTLPSYLYIPGPQDAAPQLAVPWDQAPAGVAGEYARARGAEVPARLVSSAKSWLCHPTVDRTASVL